MILRILPLLLCAGLLAACGAGESASPAAADVRFDTVAGFRLGMLLPEAREVAALRGERLDCKPATSVLTREGLGDSIYRTILQTDYCDPPAEHYRLTFDQGSLRQVKLSYSEDWARVPVDTLVGRLAERAGPPARREVYTYGDEDRELLVSWHRDPVPGMMLLRCPEQGPAHYCTREHYFSPN